MNQFKIIIAAVTVLAVSASISRAVPLDSYESFARAMMAQRDGDADVALANYKYVIENDKNAVSVYREIALLYWQMGKQAEALETAQKLNDVSGGDVSTQLFLGSFYVMAGKPDTAKEALEKVIKLDPGNETAILYLAVYHTDNNPQLSLDYWNKYIKVQPDYADGWHQMGVILEKLGQDNKALEAYEKAVSIAPDDPGARLALAALFEKSGEIDKAAEQYDKFLLIDPKNFSAAVHLAGLYHGLKKYDRAEEAFLKAQAINPKDDSITYWLAVVADEKKDYDSAIKYMELYAKKDPNAVIMTRLGYLYSYKNDLKNSLRCLKLASTADPNNPFVYFLMGLNYVDSKDLNNAKKSMSRAVELKPDMAEAHFQLGMILDVTGKFEKAVPEIEKAIELKPDYGAAMNYLGYSYADKGVNLDKAETLITKALALDNGNPAYKDSLGWLYFRKGNYEEAVKLLEKAATDTRDPLIYEHYGDCLVKLGKNAEAWEAYQNALPRAGKAAAKTLAAKIATSEGFVIPKTIQRKVLKRAIGNLLQISTLQSKFSASGVFSDNNMHGIGSFVYQRPDRWRVDVLGGLFAPRLVIVRNNGIKIYPEALESELNGRALKFFDILSGFLNSELLNSFDSDQVVSERKGDTFIYRVNDKSLFLNGKNGAVSEYISADARVEFGKYQWVGGLYLPSEMAIYVIGEKSAVKIRFKDHILNDELKDNVFEINPAQADPSPSEGQSK